MKVHPVVPVDRRTDRYGEGNSRLLQFCESVLNVLT